MKLKLSYSELEHLQELQKDTALNRKQYIKVTVLVMLHQGHMTVASSLGINDNTVYRHVKAYKKVDIQVYLSDKFVAYRGKLSGRTTYRYSPRS